MSSQDSDALKDPESKNLCSEAKKRKLDSDQHGATASDEKTTDANTAQEISKDKIECEASKDTSTGALDTDSLENTCKTEMDKSSQAAEKTGDGDKIENQVDDNEKLPDPLGYTREKDFTSEIFKVQVHNLPKFGFSDLKKRFKTHLGLNPHKIKSPDRYVAYVCFRNEEDRDMALQKINGHVWKGYTLEAKIAAPVADPYLQKKQQVREKVGETGTSDSSAQDERLMTPKQAEERLKANVCPLWNVEYAQQLEQKTEKIKATLRRVTTDNFVKWMFRNTKLQHEGMPCQLLPIIPSPETSEYRNKNEFTIGYGLDGKTVMVGFRYGMYKDGTTAVGDSTNLGIVMPAASPIVKSFREFVSNSKWTPFQQQTGSGHWQTLTVRTLRTGDVMVMVDFVPRDLQESEIKEARDAVKEFYTTGQGSTVNIKSLYFRVVSRKGRNSPSDVQLLMGQKHVYESLGDMKFRISPEAFFQVNTPGAEKLYSLITEWCEASPSTTVLDVCCGTGTIGLAMAKNVKEVIGIEMCPQAVEDAKANAELNGVTNATYYSSKVEDVIHNIVSSIESSQSTIGDVVAVVDPPRAGLHKDVIRCLRKCTSIRRLVYVSCNPDSAFTNFIDLIRPETSRHKGYPFTIVKAKPVDLFPGTKHCELVLLLNRASADASKNDGTAAEISVEPVPESDVKA